VARQFTSVAAFCERRSFSPASVQQDGPANVVRQNRAVTDRRYRTQNALESGGGASATERRHRFGLNISQTCSAVRVETIVVHPAAAG